MYLKFLLLMRKKKKKILRVVELQHHSGLSILQTVTGKY